MTNIFKVALVSLAVIASANVANAGGAKTFDLDRFQQEVEAGGSLYRD